MISSISKYLPSLPAKTRSPRGVLIIVENLPVPFDRRVWQEARALHEAGYVVSVICPKGKGYDAREEEINGIHIYRHPLPKERNGAIGYLLEYGTALFWQFLLSLKILKRHGFEAVHACNPPDLIFIVAAFYKMFFGKKFVFDQHDLCPELYEVKFGKRGGFYRLLLLFERCTFRLADVSIATNDTFKEIAVSRGRMPDSKVFVVKSYPDLERFVRTEPAAAVDSRFKFVVGYIGIMAKQDGVDLLIRAIAHVVVSLGRRDIGCVVVGDGPEYANLVSLAQSLGVEEHIVFTGYLSGSALLSHLSAFDIGVIPDPPNGCNEKLSMNKVFEYMALGIPFVQFNLAQSRREAGEGGFVVDAVTPVGLAGGIVQLLSDEPRRQNMSDYAKRHASREFRWSNEKTKLLLAYDTVFGSEPVQIPRGAEADGIIA